jgi:hypothetical protein
LTPSHLCRCYLTASSSPNIPPPYHHSPPNLVFSDADNFYDLTSEKLDVSEKGKDGVGERRREGEWEREKESGREEERRRRGVQNTHTPTHVQGSFESTFVEAEGASTLEIIRRVNGLIFVHVRDGLYIFLSATLGLLLSLFCESHSKHVCVCV